MRAVCSRLTFCGALLLGLTSAAQEGNARAEALARSSPSARRAFAALKTQAARIRDPQLKAVTQALLDNPAPTFMARWPDAEGRVRVRAALIAAGLLDAKVSTAALFPPLIAPALAPQSFLAAPGGTLDGHHAYPGGLSEHTQVNVRTSLDAGANYQAAYGIALDGDWLRAAPILHDAMKPWALQWKADGTLTEQATIAGTASHHIFILAEVLHRGVSGPFIVALASAHEAPGLAPEKIVAFIRAAALLAGVDGVELGLLAKSASEDSWTLAQPPPIEASINHLADHDYVVTEPGAHSVNAALDRWMASANNPRHLEPAEARWNRYRIETQIPAMTLYAAWLRGGDVAVAQALRAGKLSPTVEPSLQETRNTSKSP